MKKITILLVIISIAHFSFCQQTTTDVPEIKTDFLKKSKNQKKTAWIMMGGGATLLLTGLLIPKGDVVHEGFLGNDYENDGIKNIFGIVGFASMLGSIPFFIASGKNKKKATAVSFKNEKVTQLYTGSFIHHSIPSVNLKVSL